MRWARRFQKIDITEPSVEETVQIINGLKPDTKRTMMRRYTAKAVRAAVELAVKYINDRHLPDKAIDVIDEAGARARLMPVSKRKKTVNVAGYRISGGSALRGSLRESVSAAIATR